MARWKAAVTLALSGALVLAAAEFTGDQDKDRSRILARRNWWAYQPVKPPEFQR